MEWSASPGACDDERPKSKIGQIVVGIAVY
jgi:hypothetical protein